MASLGDTTSLIDILRNMNSKQIAAVLFVVIAAVGGAFWVENRYAKLVDTQNNIQQQQTQILQLQSQILTVVNSLPVDVRKEIIERSTTSKALNIDKSNYIKQ